MPYQSVFKRYEIKYILTEHQTRMLKEVMLKYMSGDKYGNSTVCNLYFDTPDYLLIRRSIEKPVYKEKLRLRSYGIADENGKTFFELKKKYDSVVYKRRISLRGCRTGEDIENRLPDTQIGREIAFCFLRYPLLKPRVFLSYEREAFYADGDKNLRITFDRNVLWRDYDLTLSKGIYGNPVTNSGKVLMEVKTATSMPLWLVKFLSENKIYKTSFSKYGKAYLEILSSLKGDKKSA